MRQKIPFFTIQEWKQNILTYFKNKFNFQNPLVCDLFMGRYIAITRFEYMRV